MVYIKWEKIDITPSWGESHKNKATQEKDSLANINMAEKGKEAKLPPPCFSSPPQGPWWLPA